MDLARAVDAVNQDSGTEREEATDSHRVADPAEISKGFLAKAPVALLVEPVDRKSKKRHERKREVVYEVLAEELKRVAQAERKLRREARDLQPERQTTRRSRPLPSASCRFLIGEASVCGSNPGRLKRPSSRCSIDRLGLQPGHYDPLWHVHHGSERRDLRSAPAVLPPTPRMSVLSSRRTIMRP